MSGSFIDSVVSHMARGNDRMAKLAVILPSRRSCLYFKIRLLDEFKDETVWLPAIWSIQDFLYGQVSHTILPEQELLARLHRVHGSITGQNQEYGEFQSWGQMILKDFNEIDNYLIDPDYLFHYVREFKSIEADQVLSEAQLEILGRFWDNFPKDVASGVRTRFLETWESLGEIYTRFNRELEEEGASYEGRAYRELLSRLESREKRFDRQHFVIAGFNALSTFEERLFQHLAQYYDTQFFWDAETRWLEDKESQPGRFIQRYTSLFPAESSIVISNSAIPALKKIEIAELPIDGLQVDYALDLVRQWGAQGTALILCDESLVYPLSLRIGQGESAVDGFKANITMGFPVSMSAPAGLLKDSAALQDHWLANGKISPTLMLKVTGYSGVRNILPGHALQEFERRIRQWGFISRKDLDELFGSSHPLFNELIPEKLPQGGKGAARRVRSLASILELMPPGPEGSHSENAIRSCLLEQLGLLETWCITHDVNLPPGGFWPVIRRHIDGLKAPFESNDPDDALQVMGFLETRILDFRNVIVLSADERNLPGNHRHSSFIPYSIKRGLDMPTHREHDAIFSYHFFRLMQRCERIALLYAPQANGGKQSRSRFIEQLLYEWSGRDDISIVEKVVSAPVPSAKIPEKITVSKKTKHVMHELQKYIHGEKQFSASSLIRYVHCPLQFYLAYVAGLEEPEQFSEDHDQRDLGRVLHRAMELFYGPFLGSGERIDRQRLEAYVKDIDLAAVISEAYSREGYQLSGGSVQDLKGQNLLVYEVIAELMRKIIDNDMEGPPFRIVGLEMRIDSVELNLRDGRAVRIKGFLDRVDEVYEGSGNTYIRIVDYKTGKAEMRNSSNHSAEDYFRGYFKNSAYKEGFQGYLYAWIYGRTHPGSKLKVAFYTARELNQGLKYLSDGKTIDEEGLHIFENYLRELICEILDEETSFTQTEKNDAYKFSAYAVLTDQ